MSLRIFVFENAKLTCKKGFCFQSLSFLCQGNLKIWLKSISTSILIILIAEIQ